MGLLDAGAALTQEELGRVQAAFARALAVRGKGPEAQALADQVLESGNADKLVKAITHHVEGRDPRTVRARGRHEETDS